MIKFDIKKDITKVKSNKKHETNLEIQENDKTDKFIEGKQVIETLKTYFNTTMEFTQKIKVPRGDDDWYKHCGIVIRKMSKEYPESQKYLISYLVSHILEGLLFQEKLNVMNYLYSLDVIEKTSFEWFAKEYFELNSIKTNKFTVFIMYNLKKRMIMILNESNQWIVAEPEDQREIASAKETKEKLNLTVDNYNRIVGFVGYEKKNRFLVFKTKDMQSKRDTGARCDEAGKIKVLQKINDILGEVK
jgi:hypothetical protein